MAEEIKRLAEWMKESKFTVVLTGAGMSTESGIPDFRSESGWWKNIDPRTVATVEALEENYDLFHEFYSTRIKALDDIEPHEGHRIISKWERDKLVHTVATQNVDRLHQKAFSKNVYELHGNIETIRCHSCDKEADEDDFLYKDVCAHCGGKLRPNVVLFGEMLPQDAWQNALQDMKKADLVIVIGTSLEVYPVNELPTMTNGKTVIINYDLVSSSEEFDLVIQGKAKEVLEQVAGEL